MKLKDDNITSCVVVMSMLQVNVTFFLAPAGKVGSKSKEDAPYELENQFVLRLPTVSICRFLFPSSVK